LTPPPSSGAITIEATLVAASSESTTIGFNNIADSISSGRFSNAIQNTTSNLAWIKHVRNFMFCDGSTFQCPGSAANVTERKDIDLGYGKGVQDFKLSQHRFLKVYCFPWSCLLCHLKKMIFYFPNILNV
jgi:hypothetical protein